MSQSQPDGYVLGELEKLVLECVQSFNDVDLAAYLYLDINTAGVDLVECGLLEERDGGLWVTAQGRQYLGAA